MNNHQKLFILIIVVAAVAAYLLVIGWTDAKVVRGQMQADINLIQPVTAAAPPVDDSATAPKSNNLKIFAESAAANSESKNSLAWTFGKNRQTGWYLYVPLIQHTIGSIDAPESNEFAAALAEWQKKNALAPSGKLDGDTMMGFVKYWQTRRMPKLFEADESKLFRAPITDFYDPTREANLLNVERETYDAYKKMIAAAAKDLNLKTDKNGNLIGADNFLKIVSAHRSRAYQEQLRKKEPNAGRAQLAFTSPHFTGRALDIYVGGEPVTTKDPNRAVQIETEAYKWLVKNAEKFGFHPYFYEPWHWEYVPGNK